MENARQTAYRALLRVEKDAAYSNLELDAVLQGSGLDARDKALASALFYGVLERRITLDYQLTHRLTKPLAKLKMGVQAVLRMGAYQLLYMNKIPASAAVNESIKLLKTTGNAYAAGLVNAVLRGIEREPAPLPDPQADPVFYDSVRYAFPPWLVQLWRDTYGTENARQLMDACVGRPPLTVRVNTLKTTPQDLMERLQAEGIEAEPVEKMPEALVLKHTGAIEALPVFREGLFHVQDLASQYCCRAVDAKPGQAVLDLCAAPGGKTCTLAQLMEDRGRILARDIYPARVKLIMESARRLGITMIEGQTGDALQWDEGLPRFDRVLCDVPCSGLGIIRRKPEIRHKKPEELDKLPELQYRILETGSRYVKSGGKLIYATCTLNSAENEDVAGRFCEAHPDFIPAALPWESQSSQPKFMQTFMPHLQGTDGFFVACLQKRSL